MRLRKNKSVPEQGRANRQVSRAGNSPAFSYYNSRGSAQVDRSRQQERPVASVDTPKRIQSRVPRSLTRVPVLLLVAVIVVCVIKIVVLSSSPKIIILGKNSVSATYLQPISAYATAAQHVLASSLANHIKPTANLDGTASHLERQFPELQSVSVTVPLVGNRPIVYLEAAQPSVVLQTTHGNYALSSTGVVLAKLQQVPANVSLVTDQSGATPVPGKQYLSGTTVSFIRTVAFQLQAAHLAISTFVLPPQSPYELDVRLAGQSYVVRCNLEADALTQSGALIASLQQLATAPSTYLDIRVPDRVYYK